MIGFLIRMTSSIEGKGTKMIDLVSRLKVTSAKKTAAPQPKQKAVAAIKVPTATKATVTAPAVKRTPAAVTVKVQPATTATVTPARRCIIPTVVNTPKPVSTTAIDQAILNRGLQNKQATPAPTANKAANQEIIDKYKAEYQKFLKQLENMDFGSLIFGQPTAQTTPAPATTAKTTQTVVQKAPTPAPAPAPAPAIVEAPVEKKAEPAVAQHEPAPVNSLLGDFANGISVGEEMGDKVIVPAKRTRRKKAVVSE